VYPETETSDLIRVVGVFLLSLEDISNVCIISNSLSFVPRDDAKVFVLFVLFVFVFFSSAFKVVVVGVLFDVRNWTREGKMM